MAKTQPQETDKLESARQQGQAQFDSIKEMIEELERFRADEAGNMESSIEDAEQRIHEDPLSTQVRSGWYSPGARDAATAPAEYKILLCTGGPACRIIGTLSEHGEPETARLEVQDWFQPWTQIRPVAGMIGTEGDERDPIRPQYDSEPVMLAYARCFYFGEG